MKILHGNRDFRNAIFSLNIFHVLQAELKATLYRIKLNVSTYHYFICDLKIKSMTSFWWIID